MRRKKKMPKNKEDPKKAIKELAEELVEDIRKGKNPHFDVPIRSLSNISFDKHKRTLMLGNKTSERELFNASHIKKFLQTLEVARAAKTQLLDTGKHESLRGIFYMCKRTIPGTNINIVDDQKETDSAIEDLELITNFSREQLHINANKNGSVAGKVIIEDRGDTIDWSKLGSGGW